MAGMLGPLAFLGDEVVNKVGSTVIDDLPQNQFVKKTADIANQAGIDALEKVPVLGDAIKIGKEKYNWTENQIGKIVHGTAEDIKGEFGDDAVPDNAVDELENHEFKKDEVGALTEEQVQAQEQKHLNDVLNKSADSFSTQLKKHKTDFIKIAWEKLSRGKLNVADKNFLSSIKFNNQGSINKSAFNRLPAIIRKRFFDIIEKDDSGFDLNTRKLLTSGLNRPKPASIPSFSSFPSLDQDEIIGGKGDFELKELDPSGKDLGSRKLFDKPEGKFDEQQGKFDEQLTTRQLQLQKDAELIKKVLKQKPPRATTPVPDLQKLVDTLDDNEKQFAQSETDFIKERFGSLKLAEKAKETDVLDAINERETALLNKGIDPDADFSKISIKKVPIKPGIQTDIPPTTTTPAKPAITKSFSEEKILKGDLSELSKEDKVKLNKQIKEGNEEGKTFQESVKKFVNKNKPEPVKPKDIPVKPGIQEDIPPTGIPKVDTAKTGEGPRTIGGLTKKELAIGAGGAGAGGLAGLAIGSGNAQDLLPGVADRNNIPGEIQKIIKGILDGPESPEKKKIEESINDIVDNEKNIDKSDQGAKVALKIFNQPSVSQVENNQNKSNLDAAESKVQTLKSQLTERVGRLSRQARLAKSSLERRKRKKQEQDSLKKMVERDEKLVRERFDRLPSELAGVIRPSLAGDSMRKPVNVNIVNRVQSPSNIEGPNQKVNDGVLQKGRGQGQRIKPMKQPRIRKINEMNSNEFLMKKNNLGVLREKK